MVKKGIFIVLLLIQGYYSYATRQQPDKFIYNGTEYDVLDIEFKNNFINIYSLGIRPILLHTGCWRGYFATYSINENNILVLNKLYTNNGNNINNKISEINGIMPIVSTPERLIDEYKDYRILTYENINLIINYTGYIIISLRNNRNENRSIYIRLNFNNGVLISTQNIPSQEIQNNYYPYRYLY
jgi:hypothetical protein